MRRSIPAALVSLLALAAPPPADAARAPDRGAPFRIAALDSSRRFDANRLDLRTTNLGWLGVDPTFFGGGLEFPRGSGSSVIFASGLWVGGLIAGAPRVTVAEYASEWRPGRILGGLPEPPASPDLRSWKVVPAGAWRGPLDSARVVSPGPGDPIAHEAWSAYVARAAATGAPTRTVSLPQGTAPGPDLPGDLALWSVFHDADASAHAHPATGTPPLGLEIRQTVFGFATTPSNVAFVRWTIHHRGTAPIDSAYAAFWADPDVGAGGDDLVGWDPVRQMGYAYNATNSDAVYGDRPPALGVRFLAGPTGNEAGAFSMYLGGSDPDTVTRVYDLLRGRRSDGQPWIDPGTSQPTRFPFPGDPVAGTGWLDANPADRRFLVSSGPFQLAPGDSVELLYAVGVGQDRDRLASIARLRCQADLAREAADAAFAPRFPARLATTEATSAPGGVRIRWHAEGAGLRPLDVLRHAGGPLDPWPDVAETRARLDPDASGDLQYDDAPLATGERWTYGLFDACDPLRPLATVTLLGPLPGPAFRVTSPFRPGTLELFLSNAFAGPARLEGFAVGGRRVLQRELVLPPGTSVLALPGIGRFPPGLYVFRLTQGGTSRTARAVALP